MMITHYWVIKAASLDTTDEKEDIETNKIIILQVGERTFKTYKSTLTKSPYFKALLSDKFGDKQSDGSYFIDRDGEYFVYLLRFLRCGYVEIPSENARTIQIEAEYYQVPMDFSEVSRRLSLQPVHVTIGQQLVLDHDGKIYDISVLPKHDPARQRKWAAWMWNILINNEPLLGSLDLKVYCLNKEECITITRYDPSKSGRGRAPWTVLRGFMTHILQVNEYEITFDNRTENKEFWMRPKIPKTTFMIRGISGLRD